MVKFSSVFTGREFFLTDHIVNGQKILPGLAYIEMVRAAAEAALSVGKSGKGRIQLKNLVWEGLLSVINEPVKVTIGLWPGENREIAYEIYRESDPGDEDVLLHHGIAEITSSGEESAIEIKSLSEQKWDRVLSQEKFYASCKEKGIEYGPGLRGIDTLYAREGEVLAKLIVPSSMAENMKQFVLHPTILDSAFQALSALIPGAGIARAVMPQTLDELLIMGGCTRSMWALIRCREEKEKILYDIDIRNEAGMPCVSIKGLVIAPVESTQHHEILMFESVWKEQPVSSETTEHQYFSWLVFLLDCYTEAAGEIEAGIKGVRCISLNFDENTSRIEERYLACAGKIMAEIQGILKIKPEGQVLIQGIVPNSGGKQLLSGLLGILKTARLENPQISGQILELESDENGEGLVSKLKENARNPEENHVRYRDGKRWVEELTEVQSVQAGNDIPWKDGGVYLITGGTGGLGRIIARDIADKVKKPVLLLTGRSPLNREKESLIKELKEKDAMAEYSRVDAANNEEVAALFTGIKEKYGRCDGIIHTAGVIKDSFIIKKSMEEIEQVFNPKVRGLVNLDKASRELNPGLFIMFSSIAGFMGNIGQSDYAAANAFMDNYARYRKSETGEMQEHGKTISINWPLWKQGGMKVNPENEKILLRQTGIAAMETENGIHTLYKSIALGKEQVIVFGGNVDQIRQYFYTFKASTEKRPSGKAKEVTNQEIDINLLKEKAVNYFKNLLSETLRMPAQKIEADARFEKYGIDSIMIMQMTSQLEEVFGALSKTLFFEYQDIVSLTDYFLNSHRDSLVKVTGYGKENVTGREINIPVSTGHNTGTIKKKRRFVMIHELGAGKQDSKTGKSMDIAVIGMSGRFPGARNLLEFWENLKNGKDCIGEIPADRWSLEDFYYPDKFEASKFGKSYSKWGGFIEGFSEFDPLFFNISPRDACIIDPQERVFVECCWETIEDAGYTHQVIKDKFESKVGVFVGITKTGFELYGPELWSKGKNEFPRVSFCSVANRVSYLMDLSGPSMPIDTMCSSSLLAVHEACESLCRGECEMSLAGGVNLYLHPSNYIELCFVQMLSEDGRCKTFGKDANGYVPGEGVGVLLLKRLKDALRDEDHIYGVIRGSSINHGGKTNGYTVPNPVAQSEVIRKALERSGINARTISYLEAHGTGTSLGDPIEITGLTKAFRPYTADNQFCAIGAVKTNIGHLESAAGIASMIKVLLQLKHRELAPSLHAGELNPNINFNETPFKVQHVFDEWKSEGPRRAGVSSFGAAGANAHVIIEEFIPAGDPGLFIVTGQDPAIIVLSARDGEGLKAKARDLLGTIERENYGDEKVADIAYTLQIGREGMEERIGFPAAAMDEVLTTLKRYIKGDEGIPDFYQGKLKQNKETISALVSDEEMQEAINKWIQKKKYWKLIELWVKGLTFDWNRLYGEKKPRRMSLPPYPFTRDKYWLDGINERKSGHGARLMHLHPLLHANTSSLMEQRFSSEFSGQEFFLAHHKVNGKMLLPGVAYLEMARAAVAAAAELEKNGQVRINLKNVIWAVPFIVDNEPVKLHIGILPGNTGEIQFEVYSENQAGEVITHTQGTADMVNAKSEVRIDLAALQKQQWEREISSDECYAIFTELGIDYGPGHRGIERIYVGNKQSIAKLSMPSTVIQDAGEYVLHPAMMDSAFQAMIGLLTAGGESDSVLPFAIDEVEILGGCVQSMWAVIRESEGENSRKINIDICEDSGKVCVRMKGLSLRDIGEGKQQKVLMFEPVWEEESVIMGSIRPEYKERLVFFFEPGEMAADGIETRMDGARCIVLRPGDRDSGIEERYPAYAGRMIEEIRDILKRKQEGRVLIQGVVSPAGEKSLFTGLKGILMTAEIENPKITGQFVELEGIEDAEKIVTVLSESSRDAGASHIRYQKNKRLVKRWKEVEINLRDLKAPWKDGGVYLITGGMGKIGRIITGDIVNKTRGTVILLTGRSSLDTEKKAWIEKLEGNGAKIEYHPVDVTRKDHIEKLMHTIKEKFGKLDGIFHIAGIVHDRFIFSMEPGQTEEVLGPKVKGLVYIDQASRQLNPGFILLFSSISGARGNVMQADYAAANAFMDAYAVYRNSEDVLQQGRGKILSINWPLWKKGGMRVNAESERLMKQQTGMVPMETENGIPALYQCILLGKDHVAVMEGNSDQVRRTFLFVDKHVDDEPVVSDEKDRMTGETDGVFRGKAVNYFKNLLSSILKLPAHKIEVDAPLEKYGIDSIMVMQMTNQLESVFGSLSKTLFFEYQDISSLTDYFIKTYRKKLIEIVGEDDKKVNTEDSKITAGDSQNINKDTGSIPPGRRKRGPRHFLTGTGTQGKADRKMEIAIIGLSGRYPGAHNIEEFWENLKNGVDSISEIPLERWNWKELFDEDKTRQGKIYTKWGGFIDGVDEFDPMFFNISPREAMIIDPQERLFLECAYKTLEDAGYTRESIGKGRGDSLGVRVGVYAGVMYEEYQLYGVQGQAHGQMFALPGSPSSIANRVSYVLNFQGPSMTVDTMCSSSLTAIHLACHSLERGECDAAIAGGVNASLHPNKYLFLSQMNFASSNGRCESFGRGGDGYVPGEGVGAVLLKKLSKAEEDGDHIYAVIRGSLLNAGGKTNGYTVPNPLAQADLINEALLIAGVNPRSISYIEAHGTGTSLGDPIEITGLTRAFRKYTEDKQFCAIGSVKSNIGHCESAAGISGLTKLLLQIKHKKLVPSIHSEELNPNINFAESPFFVQRNLSEWKSESGRIAGISSFGAGGANAYLIIEEYIPANGDNGYFKVSKKKPAIIVLSAREEKQLKEQVLNLLKTIDRENYGDEMLPRIAYTLQTGREGMEERLGLTASTIKELVEKLISFIKGEDKGGDLYRGQVKRNKEALSLFTADDDLQKAMENWLHKGKFEKILDLWVKGLVFDWNRLYEGKKPHKMSLPTYPFARQRYWIQGMEKVQNKPQTAVRRLHPLLQENISTLIEQRFSSEFAGDEFFLNGHKVNGQKILPGAVYLEMARAAVKTAAEIEDQENLKICLKNIVWAEPVIVNDNPVHVRIGLVPGDNGEIIYEVYNGKNGKIPVIYNQGTAEIMEAVKEVKINLEALRSRQWRRKISPDDCYREFSEMGIEYGPGHRGIQTIFIGDMEAMAVLSIPGPVSESAGEYILHPAIVDSVFQAAACFLAGTGTVPVKARVLPSLPVTLDEIEIHNSCSLKMYALIRYNGNDRQEAAMGKFDMDVYNDEGIMCIRIRGLGYDVKTQSLYRSRISGEKVRDLDKGNEQIIKQGIEQDSQQVPGKQGTVSEEPIQEYLAGSLAETLYVNASEIDMDRKFIDMGMDSIIAVEWLDIVNKKYGVSISAIKIYEYPSVREFAGYIARVLNENGIAGTEAMDDKEKEKQEKSSASVSISLTPLAVPPPGPAGNLQKEVPLSGKPKGITLRPVTNKQINTEKSSDQQKPVISLTVKEDVLVSNDIQTEGAIPVPGESVVDYLLQSLAEYMYVEPAGITADKKFIELEVDEVLAEEWIRIINDTYNISLKTSIIKDHQTIRELAGYIESEFIKKQ